MSLWVEIGSSFLAGVLLAAVGLRVMMRRRLTWRALPLARRISGNTQSPPLLIQNGPWRMDLSLGSQSASLYTRAYIARNRTFALRAPETVYYAASHDSSGRKLQGASTYSIESDTEPDARWWSLTVYKHRHLIPNVLGRYSFSKTTVVRKSGVTWRVLLSPRHQAENWLPSGDPNGDLVLILRFYGPGPELLSNPGKVRLPQITEVAAS